MRKTLLAALVAMSCAAYETTFQVAKESEIVANIILDADEPAAAILTLDGGFEQTLIATGVPHRISLGRLSAGDHRLSIMPDAKLSSSAPKVRSVRFEEHTTPEHDHSPIIYSRDRSFSDVPLLMYCQPLSDGSLEYTVIFSNEDGGTSTRALMARWGRATDIEYIYRVWPRSGRAIVQGKNHVDTEFTGPFENKHPVLAVVTTNNMVAAAPQQRSGNRFALAPLVLKDLGGSREAVMDRVPETYAVMAKELEREGKLRPFGVVDGQKISDPRNYAYIEYEATHQNSAFSVALALQDGRVFVNDLGRPDYAISRDGPVRTTVELPPGTHASDISQIEFRCFVPPPSGRAAAFALAGTCKLQRVRKAFFLSRDYLPGPSWFSTDGAPALPTGQGVSFSVSGRSR